MKIQKELYTDISNSILNTNSNLESLISNSICPIKNLYSIVYADINKVIDIRWLKSQVKEFLIHKDFKLLTTAHTELVILMCYNSIEFNEDINQYVYYLSLIFYNSFLNSLIPRCNQPILIQSFEQVKGTNLLKQKQTVINALKYLTEMISAKYGEKFKKEKENAINYELMVYELRTRIAQTLKSISKKYYYIVQNQMNENTVDIDKYVQKLSYKILMLGVINIPDQCSFNENEINKIKEITDENQIYDMVMEIQEYTNFEMSQQKILKNKNNFTNTLQIMKDLDISEDAFKCLILTLINTVNE